jgi:RimJ/RimL family protein N-acetyltransferase
MMTNQKNLHKISALKRIVVKDDIFLRPLQSDDASEILSILDADPTIRERVSIARRMVDKRAFDKEIAAYLNDGDVIRYGIVDGSGIIGLLSFWRLGDSLVSYIPDSVPDFDTYGFGYFLDPSKRGRGIVPDALQMIINVAKKSIDSCKFIAFCEDDNPSSIRVLEKAGFAKTDTIVHFPDEDWLERLYVITL